MMFPFLLAVRVSFEVVMTVGSADAHLIVNGCFCGLHLQKCDLAFCSLDPIVAPDHPCTHFFTGTKQP